MKNILDMMKSKFAAMMMLGLLSIYAYASDKPSWIVSPERNGFISVVGFAPKQSVGGEAAQRRVALLKARQQLGQMVRVRVENNFRHEQQVVNGYVSQTVDSDTRLSSQAALNLSNATVTAQWFDSANGDLYLLLELTEFQP
jgi:outer membrane protein W